MMKARHYVSECEVCDPSGTLFHLLLWDCIYLPLPYAFQNPFDFLPVDFGMSTFWTVRQEVVELTLEEMMGMTDNAIAGIVSSSRGL